MTNHEATFEIRSRADAHAVQALLERVYDTFREELRETGGLDARKQEALEAFETLREASQEPSRGTLTVVYDREGTGLDD
ncbi:hypothetical protein ACFO0N_18095 [Halobium salinum]|uniref:Uncharacterized protein n=1 Tax=Halobium salinum TaxID=1364940 RepID=A0ABD5PG32_9EURY|nr:hypothetical protein [Halobium salinum]